MISVISCRSDITSGDETGGRIQGSDQCEQSSMDAAKIHG